MTLPLERLRSDFAIQIAMIADENGVGCKHGPDPDAWADALEAAIGDGLEAAYERKEARS